MTNQPLNRSQAHAAQALAARQAADAAKAAEEARRRAAEEARAKAAEEAKARVAAQAGTDVHEAITDRAWAWEGGDELPPPPAGEALEGLDPADLQASLEAAAAELNYQADAAAFFEKDGDRNGYLSSEELKGDFQRADGNADGKVTLDEYLAHKALYREDKADFQAADADGNDYLSSDEVADQAAFQGMDTNADGKVTWKEYRVAQATARDAAAATATATTDAPEAPAAEPVGTYTTAYPHSDAELAAQLGFGSAEALHAANPTLRETYPDGQIPAGTPISAPASATAVHTAMAQRDAENGGGRYTAPSGTATAAPAAPAGADSPMTGAPATPGTSVSATPGDPNSYHMTQFYHEQWNPQGPNASANCGPTSLAMALKAFGLGVPGAPDPNANVEGFIDATRMAMTGNTDDHAYTDTSQIMAGAQAAGANAAPVGFEGLDQALAEGKLVVAAGNPAAYNGDWADRGLSNSEYDGGHFILITGKDANGNYLINDPLSNVGSVAISPAQMEAYFAYQGWNSGVAVWP